MLSSTLLPTRVGRPAASKSAAARDQSPVRVRRRDVYLSRRRVLLIGNALSGVIPGALEVPMSTRAELPDEPLAVLAERRQVGLGGCFPPGGWGIAARSRRIQRSPGRGPARPSGRARRGPRPAGAFRPDSARRAPRETRSCPWRICGTAPPISIRPPNPSWDRRPWRFSIPPVSSAVVGSSSGTCSARCCSRPGGSAGPRRSRPAGRNGLRCSAPTSSGWPMAAQVTAMACPRG